MSMIRPKLNLDILDRLVHMFVLIAITFAIVGVFDIRNKIESDSRDRYEIYVSRLDHQVALLLANREATINFAPQIDSILENQILICEELEILCGRATKLPDVDDLDEDGLNNKYSGK